MRADEAALEDAGEAVPAQLTMNPPLGGALGWAGETEN